MFYEELNVHSMFVRPPGTSVFWGETEGKQTFCLFTRTDHRAPLKAEQAKMHKGV